MKDLPKLRTIGVYGFDESRFFRVLQDAEVDTFCDIRLRRGMRGSAYAFANSVRLQQRLSDCGIQYLHLKELAPPPNVRAGQQHEDEQLGIAKRVRTTLGISFIKAYREECLTNFNPQAFLAQVGSNAKVICLFCVERDPLACHRSLVAAQLEHDLSMNVEHLLP